MATSYDTVGNEIHRNGELVAKVIDGELVMEEGKEKYLTPCSKMVKKILAKLEDESSEPAPFLPPEEKEEEVEVEESNEEPKAEEPPPPPEEDAFTAPTDRELIKELLAQNTQLKKEIQMLHNGVNIPVDPNLISPAIRPVRKKQHNPFGWDEKEGVPPCPNGGEEGTKNPEVIAWAKKYYPEEAEDKYADFEARKAFLAAREEQKKRKKDYSSYK